MDDEAGMTCGAVYLLRGLGRCYKCEQPTRLFALMALPPFAFDDEDEEPLDDDGFLLSNVEGVEPALEVQLRAHTAGRLRPDDSRTARQTYWMNHCEHCDAKQGDHFVQGPEGPFWPYTDDEMDAIDGTRLEGPFRFGQADCSQGPMSDWRDRRHGVTQEPVPALRRKASKPRGRS